MPSKEISGGFECFKNSLGSLASQINSINACASTDIVVEDDDEWIDGSVLLCRESGRVDPCQQEM